MYMAQGLGEGFASRPVWGAWIEIILVSDSPNSDGVAPRMGRVD